MTTLTIGSLFTGAGGLDMAVERLFPNAETVWCSEVDPHAASIYARHNPDVPNLGDITAIDWADVPPVDVLHGGFPCQDISSAGKQAGIKEGTRSGLWYRFADAIGVLRPRLVLLENVSAILANGGTVVVGSLADLGYDAQWTVVRASDVGAPHQRARWFCVAYPHERGLEGRHTGSVRERAIEWFAGAGYPRPVTLPTPRVSDGNGAGAHGDGGPDLRTAVSLLPTPNAGGFNDGEDVDSFRARQERMKDRHGNGNGMGTPLAMAVKMLPTPSAADGLGGHERRGGDRGDELLLAGLAKAHDRGALLPTPKATNNENRQTAGQYGPNLGEAIRSENGARWGDYAPAIARWEQILGRPAPDPTDSKGRLSPQFVEWMQGWPDGWTEGPSRAQRLKALGNGVVPQQAVAAYRLLLERAAVPARQETS